LVNNVKVTLAKTTLCGFTPTGCLALLKNEKAYLENVSLPMLNKLQKLYSQYKDYVRVDLVMYAVLILLIMLYLIWSMFSGQ
jgi:hypothetical protein